VLLTQYCSGDKIGKNEKAENVAHMGERRGLYKVLVVLMGKPEEMRPLGRPRCRWQDNINLLAPELFFSNFSTLCI